MTKEEVRAISIDKLDLHKAKRMLDVGSGTGSVTIQAAVSFPNLEVVAIEQNEDAVALTQENIDYFGCQNITLIKGKAPVELEGQFDAIFVGGTEIFEWCEHLLVPGGRFVLNFILLENAMEAIQLAEKLEWQDLDVVSIQASRWSALGKGHYFKQQNPTIIVSAVKPERK